MNTDTLTLSTIFFTNGTSQENAATALAYWNQHQHTTIFARRSTEFAVVEEPQAATFAAYGWEQTCPEHLES